jgi:enhancing lycopene biosynthesis protein 2
MKKVAVLLSGCGVYDGAEIHESVLTLLALDEAGASVQCAAPDVRQHHVINHRTGEEAPGESRNVLVEAARIARGKIVPLSELDVESLDAIILPGGFGAAKNLCTFALEGTSATVQPEVADVLRRAHAAGKVLGFLCIAPAIAANLFGPRGVRFTIGNDPATARALSSWGGTHCDCPVTEAVTDPERRIVTSPGYMYDARISEVNAGIRRFVHAVLSLA